MEIIRFLEKYDYADIRAVEQQSSAIKLTDEETRSFSGHSKGISVRVLLKNSWGFASSNSPNASIEKLLKKAAQLAKLEKGNISLTELPQMKSHIRTHYSEASEEEKISLLADARKSIKEGVKSITFGCSDILTKKEFYNSEGAEITQEINHTYISCSCVAGNNENLQKATERDYSIHGFGKIDAHKIASNAREKVFRLMKAVLPPKGRFTVILDPEMTGVFSHEAVGHACEADSVIDRESILAGKIGKQIGNELVTIYDDPTADNFGHFEYDDDGVKGKKAELVTKGVLTSYLNSRETSKKLSHLPNGHARAMNFDSFPIVRMSNTYFKSGDASLEDVFDTSYGIYLKGMKGGSVDIFSGGFMFKAEEAYEIKNGEKIRMLRDVSLSGNILETLNHVELVARDFSTNPGFCGKFGQDVPVSDGGPHVRVGNMMVG